MRNPNIESIPKWASGLIGYKGEVYPLAESKKIPGTYYFSDTWRPVNASLNNGEVLLRDGEYYRAEIVGKSGKYFSVMLEPDYNFYEGDFVIEHSKPMCRTRGGMLIPCEELDEEFDADILERAGFI